MPNEKQISGKKILQHIVAAIHKDFNFLFAFIFYSVKVYSILITLLQTGE